MSANGRGRIFRRVRLADLVVHEERALRHVEPYDRLRGLLIRDGYEFRVPTSQVQPLDWNRAVFLNLSYFHSEDPADVLTDETISADVVAHVAWHHLAGRALGPAGATVDGLLLAESIASAFDVYLVGRLLSRGKRSSFLETQLPAMAEAARGAGLSAKEFERVLGGLATDPEAAFSELRALLFDAGSRLVRAHGTDDAARVLHRLADRRYHALLHHYNLANWILHTRVHAAPPSPRVEPAIAAVHRSLSRTPRALAWLEREWLRATEHPRVQAASRRLYTPEKP